MDWSKKSSTPVLMMMTAGLIVNVHKCIEWQFCSPLEKPISQQLALLNTLIALLHVWFDNKHITYIWNVFKRENGLLSRRPCAWPPLGFWSRSHFLLWQSSMLQGLSFVVRISNLQRRNRQYGVASWKQIEKTQRIYLCVLLACGRA